MLKKRIPTGYGRMYATVVLLVAKPYDEFMVRDGWAVLGEKNESVAFEYLCPNRYEGDDESIVSSVLNDLPKELGFQNFEIDWEASVY